MLFRRNEDCQTSYSISSDSQMFEIEIYKVIENSARISISNKLSLTSPFFQLVSLCLP